MKFSLYSISAACLLAIAVLAAGCGSDSDTLTLDEYFAEFAAIDDDVDAQFEEVFEALFPEDVEDEESLENFFMDDANLPLMLEVTTAFPRLAAESLDRVGELDPPSEVADAHDDMVDALKEMLAAFEEGIDALSEAETLAEFSELESELGSTLIDPAQERFDEACLAVVAIGEANGIPVSSISCEDDE